MIKIGYAKGLGAQDTGGSSDRESPLFILLCAFRAFYNFG